MVVGPAVVGAMVVGAMVDAAVVAAAVAAMVVGAAVVAIVVVVVVHSIASVNDATCTAIRELGAAATGHSLARCAASWREGTLRNCPSTDKTVTANAKTRMAMAFQKAGFSTTLPRKLLKSSCTLS